MARRFLEIRLFRHLAVTVSGAGSAKNRCPSKISTGLFGRAWPKSAEVPMVSRPFPVFKVFSSSAGHPDVQMRARVADFQIVYSRHPKNRETHCVGGRFRAQRGNSTALAPPLRVFDGSMGRYDLV